MGKDLMRYDRMAQNALRGVVREALKVAADVKGLPGDHHFYVSFDTQAPGVELADYLQERYPKEMTIVLEHQFWDLVVEEEKFSVGLSFSQSPEKLVIPFAAVTRFYDPSVQFGLQFDVDADDKAETTRGSRALTSAGGAKNDAAPEEPPAKKAEGDGDEGPGKIVSLDAFRKK